MKPIELILRSFFRPFLRYPLPVLAAICAFVFAVLEIHHGDSAHVYFSQYHNARNFLECLCGISLFIAFDFFCESNRLPLSTRIGLYLLGFCLLGLHSYSITAGMFDSEVIYLSRYLIIFVCFHLLVSFLPFYQEQELRAFWQYNYVLFKQILKSLLYSLTLFAGLSSAIFAMDKLFHIPVNTDYFFDLLAFLLLVFNTLFFLKGIPVSWSDYHQEIDVRKSIRLFVQFVLLPILGMYALILYIYLFKIIFSRQLPNGWVCTPILIFSILGVLTYLLIYPIRLKESNRFIFLFSRNFFYLLFPLLSLFFIAIIQRLLPYGITEDRYLVFLLGLWILILSIYIITSKKDNIIIIPLSLFLLLAIGSLGPWGLFQLSVANQVYRLEHLLKRNHLLANGKLQHPDKHSSLPPKDAASIRSIFSYLNKRGELDAIHPWLNEEEQTRLDSAIKQGDLVYIQSLFDGLGPESSPYEQHHIFISGTHDILHRKFPVRGFTFITEFHCTLDEGTPQPAPDSSSLRFQLSARTLQMSEPQQTLPPLSLQHLQDRLIEWYRTRDSVQTSEYRASHSLKIIREFSHVIPVPDSLMQEELDGRHFLFQQVEIVQHDTFYHIQRVNGLLLQ